MHSYDHPPDADLDAERCCLGSVLIQPERFSEVSRYIGPGDFHDPVHRTICRAIHDLHQAQQPIDHKLILSAVRDSIDDAAAIIAEIAVAVPNAENAEHYARIVREKSIRKQLWQIGSDLHEWSHNGRQTSSIITDTVCGLEDLARTDCGRLPVNLCMSDVHPEDTTWLWDQWLPEGSLALLDGDPGEGKSTITIDIASRITNGWPMPPYASEDRVYDPGNVLLMSAEDHPAKTIRKRLDAAGADTSRVHCLTGMDGGDRPPELPRDIATIEDIVAADAVKLVVIDPLMAYLSGQVDSFRDQDVRRVLHRLAIMAERTGASVLLVRHLTKDSSKAAKYRGGGSIGIIGAARSGLLVGTDPDDDSCNVLASSKSNLGPRPTSLRYSVVEAGASSRIEWLGETQATADEIGRPDKGQDRGPSKVDRCGDLLRRLLANGPRDAAEVSQLCDAAGFSKRTMMRARKELDVVAKREGFGADGTWQLHLGDYGDYSEDQL